MNRMSFGTCIKKWMLFVILATSHKVLSATTLEVTEEKPSFNLELKDTGADEKGPLFKALTEGSRLSTPPYDHYKLKIKGSSRRSIAGGFSDGGGNAVGPILFDFYENKGSSIISVNELLELEPKTQRVLHYLDASVPAVGCFSCESFGLQLRKSLSEKKIYLETKEISKLSCRNKSIVATRRQKVIACQSDTELRIYTPWLPTTTSENRTGLVVHELILSWARARFPNENQEELEEKVRDLNRRILKAQKENSSVARDIQELFGIRSFNAQQYKLSQTIKPRVRQARAAFCTNPSVDIVTGFSDTLNDPIVAEELSQSFQEMQKISKAIRNGAEPQDYSQAYNSLCEDYFVDSTPIHSPNLDILPDECIRNVKNSAQLMLTTSARKEISSSDKEMLLSMHLSGARIAANFCSGIRGLQLEKRLFMTVNKGRRMMRETYFEALNYFRYLLKQEGVIVTFSE